MSTVIVRSLYRRFCLDAKTNIHSTAIDLGKPVVAEEPVPASPTLDEPMLENPTQENPTQGNIGGYFCPEGEEMC